MAKYSRMVIMSMSDEEIAEVLKSEGASLPDHTVYMMVEELKRRKEQPQEEAYDADAEEDLQQPLEAEEDLLEDLSDYEVVEDLEELENLTEEDLDESLTEEERDRRKKERAIKELEQEQQERKRTLILASVATAVTALAIVGFMIYLFATGQL